MPPMFLFSKLSSFRFYPPRFFFLVVVSEKGGDACLNTRTEISGNRSLRARTVAYDRSGHVRAPTMYSIIGSVAASAIYKLVS